MTYLRLSLSHSLPGSLEPLSLTTVSGAVFSQWGDFSVFVFCFLFVVAVCFPIQNVDILLFVMGWLGRKRALKFY